MIRFVKSCKYYRDVPISSFYLELRCAKYASGESSIIYSIDVRNVLALLWSKGLAAIQDPAGVVGLVHACPTAAMKNAGLQKLKLAFERAEKARAAEEAGNIRAAFYWWNMVFNGNFPAYG